MARSQAVGSQHVLLVLGVVVGGLFLYHRYHGLGKTGA